MRSVFELIDELDMCTHSECSVAVGSFALKDAGSQLLSENGSLDVISSVAQLTRASGFEMS